MLQYATKEDIDRIEKRINDLIMLLRPATSASKEDEKERWVKTKEACEILNVSRPGLDKLVSLGKITKYKVFGISGSNRYDFHEIQAHRKGD